MGRVALTISDRSIRIVPQAVTSDSELLDGHGHCKAVAAVAARPAIHMPVATAARSTSSLDGPSVAGVRNRRENHIPATAATAGAGVVCRSIATVATPHIDRAAELYGVANEQHRRATAASDSPV